MNLPVLVLLGFAGWTLLILAASIGVYRWSRILTGRASIAGFPADAAQGSPWRCVGPGVAAWIPPGAETPIALAHHGERLHLPT